MPLKEHVLVTPDGQRSPGGVACFESECLMSETDPSALPVGLKHLRRLKWNERVQRGDFVADGREGFELWDGPSGFRADTFVRQTYRRLVRQPAEAKEGS